MDDSQARSDVGQYKIGSATYVQPENMPKHIFRSSTEASGPPNVRFILTSKQVGRSPASDTSKGVSDPVWFLITQR